MRLINDFEMNFIKKRLKPIYSVVLDCSGKDSIRLRPLPVVGPWFERRKATLYLQVGEGENDNDLVSMNVVIAIGTKLAFC